MYIEGLGNTVAVRQEIQLDMFQDGFGVVCVFCAGTGFIRKPMPVRNTITHYYSAVCPRCKGRPVLQWRGQQ